MRIKYFITSLFLMLFFMVQGQNLRLHEINTNKIITGDTILIQSMYTSWIGYESLDMLVTVENNSTKTMEVGAKKMELNPLQKDVLHTICFAGGCYDTGTFVSPNHSILTAGTRDSTFLSHFMFDNKVHQRGINLVGYIFYDVQNPNDSVVVYVTFNTIVKNTGIANMNGSTNYRLYPNPSKQQIYLTPTNTTFKKANLLKIHDLTGKLLLQNSVESNFGCISQDIRSLLPGIYCISLFSDDTYLSCQKFVIQR